MEVTIRRFRLAGGGHESEEGAFPIRRPPAAAPAARESLTDEQLFAPLPTLEELEKRYLEHVLAAVKGDRSRAAGVLGIAPRSLDGIVERLGVDVPAKEP
jgi:DNA-binding NtrC family response regulator